MGSEEKVRLSGDISRPSDAPILPTVNPASEKFQEPPNNGIHPAFYVMLVPPADSANASNDY